MTRTLAVLRLPLVALLAAGVSGGTASADQTLVKGRFTLLYEVRWGRALLPAGSYTIEIEGGRGPTIVRNAAGQARVMLPTMAVSRARKDLASSLLIVRREHGRTVSSFNWREGDKTFLYASLTKAEQKLGRLAVSEAVTILMAQK